MKLLFQFNFLLSVCFLFLTGCIKEGSTGIDEHGITRDIQLNTFFNLTEVNKGFILSGIKDSKVTIFRLDYNFRTIWERNNYEWGTNYYSGGWGGAFYSVEVKNVFLDAEGNTVCFCSVEEGGDEVWSSGLIIKLNKSGSEIKRIKVANSAFLNIAQTYDNGYLIFGNKLIKLNPDLSTAWENSDQNYLFSGANVISTKDKGLAVTGTWSGDQVFLQKFDQWGILQWTKRNFNQNSFNDLGYDLLQIPTGGFIIVGRTRNIKPPWDMNCFLIRTNNLGDTLWTKKFGESTNEWLENFVCSTSSDFVVKKTVGFPNDTIHGTTLLKINYDGQITATKEYDNLEKLLLTSSGYIVKAIKSGDSIIKLSKIGTNELF